MCHNTNNHVNTTVHYLLKFGAKSHIQNLYENGEIYMNTLQTFAELDKKEVGDKFERTVEIKNFGKSNLKLTSVETGKTYNFQLQTAQYKKDFLGDLGNIYSTYSLSDRLLNRKKMHRVDKRMLSFGTHCLVIHDVPKFFELIKTELKKLKLTCFHNLVQYKDYKKNSHQVTYFQKSHLYSYQHEHRFVVRNQTSLPLILNIGPLKEIADIYNANDVVQKVSFERDYGT